MNTLSIRDVVARIRDLPSLPVLVMDLLETIGKENIDIHSLAERVSQDQALTAKVLRLANSSFYGMSRQVRTIPQAISILGFETVRTLITTASVTNHFFPNDESRFDFTTFWRHALGTAVCARVLARTLRVNQEYAFVAGLLHDIGRLALVTLFTRQYDAVLAYRAEHDCFLFEAERAVLQIDHAAVGEALTLAWKFPEAMQRAIARHHQLQVAADDSLAGIVHMADVLSHALDLSHDDDCLVPPLSEARWRALRIDEGTMLQIMRESEAQFTETSQILVE